MCPAVCSRILVLFNSEELSQLLDGYFTLSQFLVLFQYLVHTYLIFALQAQGVPEFILEIAVFEAEHQFQRTTRRTHHLPE